MTKLEFAAFCNRYEGRPGWVIGRGPTQYQYSDLATVDGPVFFINDSVSQETHLAAECDSFFFAHDSEMAVWLGKIRSTAVLVTDHPFLFRPGGRGVIKGPQDPILQREGKVLLYRFGEVDPISMESESILGIETESILERSRDEIARGQQLYQKTGTIHPLLHFAWYVGCSKLYLIGCDGLPNIGYDERLPNLSNSKSHLSYIIRHHQDIMLRLLKMPVQYIGTPPHLVTFECTMAIQDHKRSEVIEYLNLDEVSLLAHTTEGSLCVNLDQSDNPGDVVIFRIQSDNYQGLVSLLEKWDAIRKFHELTTQGAFIRGPQIVMKTELC
jgi:hypothetical protein